MMTAPTFSSWQEMQSSSWLDELRTKMEQGNWPDECVRCKEIEMAGKDSIRHGSMIRHQILDRLRSDYVILGGVLDNVCNSACQSCNANLSTKIGSLSGKKYIKINNTNLLDRVPWSQVIEIDINGGEPTASQNYKNLIKNMTDAVKVLRVNTNGSKILPNLQSLLDREIQVIITMSLDGTDNVHDYVRWPISWREYKDTLRRYKEIQKSYKNFKLQTWTVIHALNISDFPKIQAFAYQHELEHNWAYLHQPSALNVRYDNSWTRSCRNFDPNIVATDKNNQTIIDQYIQKQDKLRGIDIKDYL